MLWIHHTTLVSYNYEISCPAFIIRKAIRALVARHTVRANQAVRSVLSPMFACRFDPIRQKEDGSVAVSNHSNIKEERHKICSSKGSKKKGGSERRLRLPTSGTVEFLQALVKVGESRCQVDASWLGRMRSAGLMHCRTAPCEGGGFEVPGLAEPVWDAETHRAGGREGGSQSWGSHRSGGGLCRVKRERRSWPRGEESILGLA